MREAGSETSKQKVLFVSTRQEHRAQATSAIASAGFGVTLCNTTDEALENASTDRHAVCISDVTPDDLNGGFDLFQDLSSDHPNIPIVALVSKEHEEVGFAALRSGFTDFCTLPIDSKQLATTLRKAAVRDVAVAESTSPIDAQPNAYDFSNIIARSDEMQSVFETVKRLARFHTTVLIYGESGTGKELLARAIHNNSPRRGKPFIAINCGAIPENLMESELFGHRKGAFTDATRDKKGLFEEAQGGSILLDEIGELPLHLQVKLLRALQEQQIRRVGDEELIDIDARVIAATLRNLEEDVVTGRFRDDLFYRLNVVSLNIPPLRERVDDIPVLTEYFIKRHSKRLGIKAKSCAPGVLDYLAAYQWRGNVRELENCIERALVLSEGDQITLESLPPHIQKAGRKQDDAASIEPEIEDSNLSIKQRTRALEIALIRRALLQTGGNRTHSARLLEISHRALLYKLKEYGLGGKSNDSA